MRVSPCALTRDPDGEAARDLAGLGAEVVKGDLGDRASIDRALESVDGVFSVQTFGEVGVEGEVRQGKTLADAAKDAGVSHFVYSSVGSSYRDTGIPHFDSKFEIEEHVRSLGLPYTILRPVFLMQNWEGMGQEAINSGTISMPLSPDKVLQEVAVEDVGAFATMAFKDPDQWLGREVDLAGDEMSMTRTAETFARVIGKPVQYVQMPLESFREFVGEEMAVMFQWFDDVGYEADIAALRDEYPDLNTLERYLGDHGWANAARQ